MGEYVKVADLDSIKPGQARCVTAGARRVALFNHEGTLYAIDDQCTHVGGPLSEGFCENGVVVCPWHGAQFRLRDGLVLGPPARRSVKAYPVRTTSGTIEIDLGEG